MDTLRKNRISPETLQELRDLQDDKDPHFVANLLTSFLDSAKENLEKTRQALDQNNAAAMSDGAHALKSSCLNAGIEGMGALCQELESLGKGNSLEGARPLFERLCSEHKLVQEEIASLPEFAAQSKKEG